MTHLVLWNTANWVNFGLLRGHSNAILDLDLLPDGNHLLSASADKSIIYWDTETGKAIKRYRAHSSYANTVSALKSHNGNMFVSGSDDSACKIWDLRSKACSTNFKCHYPVLSACFNLTGDQVFTAGLDNVIKVWDVRTESVLYSLEGHNDTVTGIKLSPDGDYLCSNSMDNTCKVWDVKPYSKMREYRNFFGHQHGLDRNLLRCAWSPIGNYVSCGSADHNVFVWNVEKNSIEYKLPGHKSGVNDIAFHPTEPILASAGSDKVVYLGEIEY